MRRLLLFSTLALLSCLSTSASAQNIDTRLEAYISFDDCLASDDSGNGITGSFINDTTCACGARDGAIRFDGVDDAIWFASPSLGEVFRTGDFSVSFYMKPAPPTGSQQGSQVILSKQGACSLANAFSVRYNPQTRVVSSTISENDTLITTVSAKLDEDRCWQHVVVARSNNRYTLYLNGKERETKTTIARVDLTSSAILKISEPVCPLDRRYRGDLDELRIYSRAITPDDVFALNLRPDQVLNPDTLVYLGSSLQARTSESCAQQYAWVPGTGVSDSTIGNPVLTPTLTTTYTVYFRHEGCDARDTLRVTVIDPSTLDCSKIFIPNAFTPGATPGHNDRFGLSNPYAVNDFISFEIFDRWGGRVFNAETPFETWDGTFQTQPLNPGIFLYRLRWKCVGEEKVKTGTLTLLK